MQVVGVGVPSGAPSLVSRVSCLSRDRLAAMSEIGDRVECQHLDCGIVFTYDVVNKKYCDKHRDQRTRVKERRAELVERAALYPDVDVSRTGAVSRQCSREACYKKIKGEDALDRNHKFCSEECRKIAKAGRRRAANHVRAAERNADRVGGEASVMERRGEVLTAIVERGDARAIHAGEVSAAAIAEIHGFTPAAVSRAMEAYVYDVKKATQAVGWKRSKRVDAMFPTESLFRLRELGRDVDNVGLDEFQVLLEELVRAYTVASRRYSRLERKRPIIKPFHSKWIRSIIRAYATGGKLLILSPPRHGKSETLIRLFWWLIVMDPDIRIGWLAASKDIAKMMLGAVKSQLQFNEQLVKDTLPPGDVYKPAHGSGKAWGAYEFSIVQAPAYDQKSSTMIALGRTSKTLSRDMDVLAVDDIEDWDTVREKDQRIYSKEKFAEFGTRKEERTVWFNIGSRQHPDDIPHSLMDEGEDADGLHWEVIVNAAHDEVGCGLDPDTIEGHDENGCVLFPEVRSYRWLMEKKREEERLGTVGRYEMRYLNAPRPVEGLIFYVDKIKENALDHSRGIGLEGLPLGRLIGGIDPASRGTQAVAGWHSAQQKLNIFDIETQEAGGFAGALDVMERWYHEYGLTDWVYEDNAQQGEFFRDPRLLALKRELGLSVNPHTTGRNKQDPELGISAMAPLYHDGTITLPFGTPTARIKVKELLRQLELWTTDGVKRGKTDIKMAQWLPFPRLLRWLREDGAQQTRIREQRPSGYPTGSVGSEVPWRTAYPNK